MQIAQPYILRLIDYYGVSVRYVQSVLYDGSAQEKIVVSIYETEHLILELLRCHLSVSHADTHIGYEPVQYILYSGQFLHSVMQEEHLSATLELVLYYGTYFLLLEQDNLRLNRNSIRRRSRYDGAKHRQLC